MFGTDPLNEIRGASARLDWLNRFEMERCLKEYPGVWGVWRKSTPMEGSAQFLVEASGVPTVREACAQHGFAISASKRGGEVGVVYGIAPFKGTTHLIPGLHEWHISSCAANREFRNLSSKCIANSNHDGV